MKTVLVTGASRGIGREIALAFGRLKYNVAVNYRTSDKAAEETVQAIKRDGGNAVAVKADVSEYEDIHNMAETVNKTFGGIDILVNNAGIAYQGLITDMTNDQYKKIMATNFDSVFIPAARSCL